MESLLDKIVNIAQEAGNIALQYQQNGFKSFKKDRNDIVTEADLAVNDYLKDKLLNLLPDAGWLSEESIDNTLRLNLRYVWIIDPIDGTTQFVKGTDEWVISIALIENNRPIIGVIFNPRKKEMFFAERCLGAFLNDYKIENIDYKLKNGGKNPILLTTKSKSNYLKIFTKGFQKTFKIEQIGSLAYILALTSLGYSSSCLTFKKCNEWDVAAGILILKEAGGFFKTINNKADLINFNKEDTL